MEKDARWWSCGIDEWDLYNWGYDPCKGDSDNEPAEPAEMQNLLLKLYDPKEIRKFSERKLRNRQKVKSNQKSNMNDL